MGIYIGKSLDSKLEKHAMEKNHGFPHKKSSKHGACSILYVYLKSTAGTRGYGFKNKWGHKEDPQYEYVYKWSMFAMFVYWKVYHRECGGGSIKSSILWGHCREYNGI